MLPKLNAIQSLEEGLIFIESCFWVDHIQYYPQRYEKSGISSSASRGISKFAGGGGGFSCLYCRCWQLRLILTQ